jgi:hydroxymethylpyrimidine/phosphomethylpyrimidine kinase
MQTPAPEETEHDPGHPPCVLVFNANDPSGAGGLAGDVTAIASAGAHALPVITGTYARDSAETFDHFPFDEEVVAEQARTLLEDMSVAAIKVGFAGTPENLSAIAEMATDYPDVPLVAYMPNLSWWNEVQIDLYLDAFQELVLPQTTVLVGNHSTLWRWLLPDWEGERSPSARDIARAAGEFGVPYTLVTGIPAPEQYIESALASPQTVLASERLERFEAVFSGAGDTLAATLAALIAGGCDLVEAFAEALTYLDHCLDGGFRPGMGHVIPDRLFWAQADTEDPETDAEEPQGPASHMELPPHDTQH